MSANNPDLYLGAETTVFIPGHQFEGQAKAQEAKDCEGESDNTLENKPDDLWTKISALIEQGKN